MRSRTYAARTSFTFFAIIGGTLAFSSLVVALGLVAEMVMLT